MQHRLKLLLASCSFVVTAAASADTITVTGVDFADQPGMLYVPAKQIAHTCGLSIEQHRRQYLLGGKQVKNRRQLFDGTDLVSLRDLTAHGLKPVWNDAAQTATFELPSRQVLVHRGAKSAHVNKAEQTLRAYQGDLLVLQTHVSTGRKGHGTPSGDFEAARKERIHYSHLYDDSPMPYAVQINGNVFIHGFTSVPRRPASHGCIRVPLYGRNAARYFYSWVNVGTPVSVGNSWPSEGVALSGAPSNGPAHTASFPH